MSRVKTCPTERYFLQERHRHIKRSYIASATSTKLLPEERLANATIMQAISDYKSALIKIAKCPRDYTALKYKLDCERFFRSKLFCIYCDLDGEVLIRRIQNEIRHSKKG